MTIIFDGTNGITSPGGDTSNTSHSTPIVRSPSSLTLQTNGSTTAMTIDANQKVGIGTTNTLGNSLLNVAEGVVARNSGGTSPYFQLYNGTAGTDLKTWRIGGSPQGNLIIDTVNDAYSVGTERMRIDSSGRVTTPYQPAFFAFHGEGSNASKPRTSEWTSGAYNSVLFNRGNHFSGARFTAPVTGLYYFSFWVQEETFYGQWNNPISIYWWKNGTATFVYGADNPGIPSTDDESWLGGSIIVELAANDSFSASLYAPNATSGGNPWITTELNSGGFMGYLIG